MVELSDDAWLMLQAAHDLQGGVTDRLVSAAEILDAVLPHLDANTTRQIQPSIGDRYAGLYVPLQELVEEKLVEFPTEMAMPVHPYGEARSVDRVRSVFVTDEGREALAGHLATT